MSDIKENNKWLKIAALVLPILALAVMTANATVERNVGDQIWQVKMAGYDPRDLLYGHYLVYRYDWNMTEDVQRKKTMSCLCLNSSGDGFKDPLVRPVQCGAPTNNSCRSVIKAYPHGGAYSFNRDGTSERYFIPEESAADLEKLLRDGKYTFRIELMAHKNQSVSIRTLYIDDVPLETYLRRQ